MMVLTTVWVVERVSRSTGGRCGQRCDDGVTRKMSPRLVSERGEVWEVTKG